MALLNLLGNVLELQVRQGDDIAFQIPLTDDLTAYTFTGQIRDAPNQTGNLLGSFTFVVSVDNLICKVANSVTRSLPSESFYDIQITTPDNLKTTVITGKINAKPDVTI